MDSRTVIAHNPEKQQKREEAEDVEAEDDAFGEWKVLREEDVECDGQKEKGIEQQRCLPKSFHVGIRKGQLDHRLDQLCKLYAA